MADDVKPPSPEALARARAMVTYDSSDPLTVTLLAQRFTFQSVEDAIKFEDRSTFLIAQAMDEHADARAFRGVWVPGTEIGRA